MTDFVYFNAKSCKVKDKQVLLDISPKQKILNIQVKSSPEINQRLKDLIIGQGLDVVIKISAADLGDHTSFVVPELELLQEAILNFVGVLLPDALQKGYLPEDLVCRCFGVYQQDIKSFVSGKDLSELNLLHLTEELNAGAACGSCLEELKFYLSEGIQQLPFPAMPPLDKSGRRLRLKGLTPKEIAELLDKHLDVWAQSQQLPDKSIEILLIRSPFVLLRTKGEKLSSKQLRALSAWVEEKLFLHLEFRFEN